MKIVFMGTPAPAVPHLERVLGDGHEVVAVYTQPDRPAGRGNRLSAPPVKEFALERGLAVHQPTKIKTPAALEFLRGHGADAAVVVAYGRILPQSWLEAFPHGAINVHFSLLPKYRGAAPVNWAIVGGETVTGVTTMQMDAGLDTGDILLQRETAIGADENAAELMTRLAATGAELLSETLRRLAALPRIPQDHRAATLAPLMSKDDGRIEWNRPAAEIARRVRGFQPFPTSFTRLADKKLTIWRAREVAAAEESEESAAPGAIRRAKGDELLIACGNRTVLRVEELQLEGKKRMTTRDFLNGVKLAEGAVLG